MDYLTKYYKNLSEQLQERKAQLERLLNEGPEQGRILVNPMNRPIGAQMYYTDIRDPPIARQTYDSFYKKMADNVAKGERYSPQQLDNLARWAAQNGESVGDSVPVRNPAPVPVDAEQTLASKLGGKAKGLASGLARGGAAVVGTVAGDLVADAITSTPAWERRMNTLGRGTESAMSGMSPSMQDFTLGALDVAHDTTSFARNPIGHIEDKLAAADEKAMAKIQKTAPATQQEYDVAAAQARLRRAQRGIQTYD